MVGHLAKGVVGKEHGLSAIRAPVVAELVRRGGAKYQIALRTVGTLKRDFERKTVPTHLLDVRVRRIGPEGLNRNEVLSWKQGFRELRDRLVSFELSHRRLPMQFSQTSGGLTSSVPIHRRLWIGRTLNASAPGIGQSGAEATRQSRPSLNPTAPDSATNSTA